MILALAAALAAGRMWRAPAPQVPTDRRKQPRGWREARHWRKI